MSEVPVMSLFANMFLFVLFAGISLIPMIILLMLGLRFVRAQEEIARAVRDLADNRNR